MSRAPRSPRRTATRRARPRRPVRVPKGVRVLSAEDLGALRDELERGFPERHPARWNADPEDAQRALAKLVLTLVEFLRKLMERQAVRRMERRTLSAAEVENIGLALMRLEETIGQIGERFGLTPEDLQLDLGPLGRLM